ncbi:MAG TPA: DUF1697 domain-containing protein [Gemmatimonadales bacterium]|nr:DUF1697 domain-containing protein [Gemmatimonadales bacterium]
MGLPRYAAFLHGITPVNATMPGLRRAFEAAGFTRVVTVLSSGNVVFDADRAAVRALERRAEAGMRRHLGQTFVTIIRPVEGLKKFLWLDPFRSFALPPKARRVVTFLRDRPTRKLRLPMEVQGTRLLVLKGGMVFSAYVPTPQGAVFMAVIERTLGKDVTTRTWDTVARVVRK